MKNNFFKITLFFLILGIFCPQSSAMIFGNNLPSTPIKLKRNDIKDPNSRPRLPELQCVTCFNDDGLFIIEFAVPEGECYIYVETWEGGTFDQFFNSSELITTIPVGQFKEAYICITTEWGNEYYGTINGEQDL